MEFVVVLPHSQKGNNLMWVVVDHLTKSMQFISFRMEQFTKLLAEKYLQEIVRLHGVLVSLMLDKDNSVSLLEESSREFTNPPEVQHCILPAYRRTIGVDNLDS